MAFVGWIGTFEGKKGTGKEKNTESELIRELYSLGAIPIGKVSVLQVCSVLKHLLTIHSDFSCPEYLGKPDHLQSSMYVFVAYRLT
jgi:hypothetical protein